jgi:hypothetical protein
VPPAPARPQGPTLCHQRSTTRRRRPPPLPPPPPPRLRPLRHELLAPPRPLAPASRLPCLLPLAVLRRHCAPQQPRQQVGLAWATGGKEGPQSTSRTHPASASDARRAPQRRLRRPAPAQPSPRPSSPRPHPPAASAAPRPGRRRASPRGSPRAAARPAPPAEGFGGEQGSKGAEAAVGERAAQGSSACRGSALRPVPVVPGPSPPRPSAVTASGF